MTDYVKSTNFTSKDSLPSGNALKIVKGTEFDVEFNNIATAVATKADSATVTSSLALKADTATVNTALDLKAPLASPALTGTPTAPTAAVNTSTTQLATTAFVVAQIADDAPTKTGVNASGTWDISITGNSSTVTTVTSAQILAALASANLGDVGTYAWLITVPDATVTEGSTVAGSSLRYAGVYTDGSGNSGWPTGAAPAGTWRAMGTTLGGYGRTGTLFLRIS